MNILHLSPCVPDFRAGHAGAVLMSKEIEALKKDNQVYVVTFCNNAQEEKLLQDHPDYRFIKTSKLDFVRKSLIHFTLPNMFAIRKDRKYLKMICEIIEQQKIDAIHAEYTAMGQYECVKKKYPHIKFCLVEHDVVIQSYERQCDEAKGIMKIYKEIERKKVNRYEKKFLDYADVVVALNTKDEELLHDRYGIKNVCVINPYYGIDFDQPKIKVTKEKSICFVGHMGRNENHVAAMRLINIFNGMNLPGWKLNIIGGHPREELKQQEKENIHITGFVDDINLEIEKNRIAVFPLTYGAGIKIKVLQAFGLGLPVITNEVGAEGIDPDGQVLLLANTDEEFKQQMLTLMNNEELCEEISLKSAEFVKSRFDWNITEQLYREIYK